MSGCKWVDDFRARLQPDYQPLQPRPTLNRESEDFIEDDTNKTSEDERATPLPAIDGRSVLPEVPDHPAGIYY